MRQRRKNLFPVPCALILQHITPNAVANPPVKESQGAVDQRGSVTPSVADELPEILYQGCRRFWVWGKLTHECSILIIVSVSELPETAGQILRFVEDFIRLI